MDNPIGGTQVTLPDFITIGAMKCATDTLHAALGEDPRTSMSDPAELDFFLHENYRKMGHEWYERQFDTSGQAVVAGESSFNYTKRHLFPGVPERMVETVPDVKLIYVVRDPIERIESHWVQSVQAGRFRDSFETAVRYPDRSPFVMTSCYWQQLTEYLRYFSAEQILVLSYERLIREPRAVADQVLGFVGLETPAIDLRCEVDIDLRTNTRVLAGTAKAPETSGLAAAAKRLSPWSRTRKPKPKWTDESRARIERFLKPEADSLREFSGLALDDWSV